MGNTTTQPAGSSDEKKECCCPEPEKADYVEVCRKLYLRTSSPLYSDPVRVDGARAVEVDAQCLANDASATVDIDLEQSSDVINWSTANPMSPLIQLTAIGQQVASVSDISSPYLRLKYSHDTGAAVLSAGIRLQKLVDRPRLPNDILLPGLDVPVAGRPDCYVLLADRLNVAPATSAFLQPVYMRHYDTVRLEITVFNSLGPLSLDFIIQGSNDAQSWTSLVGYTPIVYGYTSPAALTNVTHRFVRVRVNGAQMTVSARVAVGMTLSRT